MDTLRRMASRILVAIIEILQAMCNRLESRGDAYYDRYSRPGDWR